MSVAPPSPSQRQARSRYQRGMLAWLQQPGDPAGLPEMRAAVRHLEAAAGGDFAPFWHSAEVFLRAISDGTLAVDAESRRLCARIDLQMRAALNGSEAPEGGLAEELQQCIRQGAGQLPPVTELISLMAKPEAPDLDAEAVAGWSAAGNAAVAAWNGRGSGDLAPFRRALIDLCAAAMSLNLPETLHLAESLAGVGDLLDAPEAAEDPYLRAAIAAALELLGDTRDLGLPVFAERVAHVAQRLAECRESQRPAVSPTLLRLFAGEIGEQAALMREELACLEPDGEALAESAHCLADHAAHLELDSAEALARGLAAAIVRAQAGHGFDHPEVREALEAALAELDTMADFLLVAQPLPEATDILEILAQV
ncbi:MAG: hypothetical protein ACOZCK_11125 [Pseudomonadota bacterium]